MWPRLAHLQRVSASPHSRVLSGPRPHLAYPGDQHRGSLWFDALPAFARQSVASQPISDSTAQTRTVTWSERLLSVSAGVLDPFLLSRRGGEGYPTSIRTSNMYIILRFLHVSTGAEVSTVPKTEAISARLQRATETDLRGAPAQQRETSTRPDFRA